MKRRTFIGSSAAAAAGLSLLNVSVSGQDSAELVFSTWGNPGEQELMKGFTQQISDAHDNFDVEYRGIPTDYPTKILTQLNGGTAPDMFYIDVPIISTFIQNGSIQSLSPFLETGASVSDPADFAEGLWGTARTEDGEIYGLPVDCNPYVLWYNQTLLEEIGIEKMPAQMFEDGEWNWEAFTSICQQLVDQGRTGYVLDASWDDRYAWTSANGSVPYTDGKFTGNTDAKFVEAVQFLVDNVHSGLFSFSGVLPQGAGKDALLQGGAAGFAAYGRWLAPQVRDLDSVFDIVPFPSNTEEKINPHPIACAMITMNAATEHPEEAFQFITNWVSSEGQLMRLDGPGNAVPSIVGAEDVVLNDDFPEHRQFLLDTRESGFVIYNEEASVPEVMGEISATFEIMFVEEGDVQEQLDTLADKVNAMIEEFSA